MATFPLYSRETPLYSPRTDAYFSGNDSLATPATPATRSPWNARELHDPDMTGVPTPLSECGSLGSSAYSPSPYGFDQKLYPAAEPMSEYRPQLSPSSLSAKMRDRMSISSATLPRLEIPSLPSIYVEPPPYNPTLSPVGPLLSLPDCGRWENYFEEDASSALSPNDGLGSLLFETNHVPSLVFQPDIEPAGFGPLSRTRSGLTASTLPSNDRLAPPRRHSFPSQQRAGGFYIVQENGPPTPDTPSSYISSSPSTSPGNTPELPATHHPTVSSPAGVHAANLRRKKKARFFCERPSCGQSFTARHNFDNHMNSHDGIKPYNCVLCNTAYTTRGTKQRHEKKCKAFVNLVASLDSPCP
ncbi:hypothetical protein DFH06DRAFT_506273 [Mycena polygramma]|nr:hypothetical protein DFH06DRAFT_506273 [Mycena polygramma]